LRVFHRSRCSVVVLNQHRTMNLPNDNVVIELWALGHGKKVLRVSAYQCVVHFHPQLSPLIPAMVMFSWKLLHRINLVEITEWWPSVLWEPKAWPWTLQSTLESGLGLDIPSALCPGHSGRLSSVVGWNLLDPRCQVIN
jgi:hypothetical protein